MPFISYSCQIALARTSRTVMNKKRVEADIFIFFIILGKSFQFFCINSDVHCWFFINGFHYDEVVSVCSELMNYFSISVWMIICFGYLNFILRHILLISFCILNCPCVPGMHPAWLWSVIHLICYGIKFTFIEDFCISIFRKNNFVVFF